ncbi:oxidase [Paracoccus suum]|uniref:Oxidase n=1 Tax=Paracoccus suum TaxID=2259340 RepID=A0A344PMJ3_9RHOB|nr:molybdopterin-dependent oxidoreductase [Paracoccus suum]AXC50598.1 oxidase [Paracoccus suum]
MFTRRQMIASAGAASGLALLGGTPSFAEAVNLGFENGERQLVSYPGKRPLLGLTARPPQLETPFSIFNDGVITPNDAFFVRYHLADIPTEIDPEAFRLEVGGKVATPLSLSLADLKSQFEPVEVVAVHQCSGNSRGFVDPRVAGGQAGNGLMGNARWTGVSLKSVLEKAGVGEGAVQVAFDGLDGPVLAETPDFTKALAVEHALDGEVMLAWAMNGEDLPWLNGFPLRLVVPGYYGTYWVKHLNQITVRDTPLDSFWMTKAYRIPDNTCACVEPGTTPAHTVPIARFNVRSFITNKVNGDVVAANAPLALRGIAFDGGYGITDVSLSADGGATWTRAKLGEDLGKYSFREWTLDLPVASGDIALMVRASNRIGQTQPMEALWNPAGYMRNVVETTHVKAA